MIYAQHQYPWKGTLAHWEEQVLQTAGRHGWRWTAWCYHPFAGPSLIADWQYRPPSFNGVPVQAALGGASLPAPTAQAAAAP